MECTKCRREIVDGAAFCPYCGEKVAEEAKPLYTAEVKGLLKSGTLAVYADRVEFMTEDGRSESCTVNRKNIHEAFLYIDKASQPYIAARQERLLTQGVRYSLVSSMGLTGGVLNVSNEAVEFKGKAGQSETTSFREVRSAAAAMSGLELTLLDGVCPEVGAESGPALFKSTGGQSFRRDAGNCHGQRDGQVLRCGPGGPGRAAGFCGEGHPALCGGPDGGF